MTLTRRHLTGLLLTAAVPVVAYVATDVVPYLASDGRDPGDLSRWNAAGIVALVGVLAMAATLLTLTSAALMAAGAALWCVLSVGGTRHGTPALALGLAAMAVVCAAALAWLTGPVGMAVADWRLD